MKNLLTGLSIIALSALVAVDVAQALELPNNKGGQAVRRNNPDLFVTPGINGNVSVPNSTIYAPTTTTTTPVAGSTTPRPTVEEAFRDFNFTGTASNAAQPGSSPTSSRRLLGENGEIPLTAEEELAITEGTVTRSCIERVKNNQEVAIVQDVQANSDRHTARTAIPSAGALACTPLFQSRVANAAIDLVQSNGFALKFFRVQALDLSNLGSKLPIGGALVGAIGAELSFMVNNLVSDIVGSVTGGLLGGGSGIDFSADDCNAMQELVTVSNCALATSSLVANLSPGGTNGVTALCGQDFPNTATLISLLR